MPPDQLRCCTLTNWYVSCFQNWRKALKSWTMKQFRWTHTTVADSDSELVERYLHRFAPHEDGSIYLSGGMSTGRALMNDVWKIDVDLLGNIRQVQAPERFRTRQASL